MKTLHQSHNSGEVWGLDIYGDNVYTTGDDNQVICWDPATRTLANRAEVNSEKRKARKNRASTLGDYPDSQSARAVAVNNSNGDVCVCANDGSLTIRNAKDLGNITKEIQDSKEWVECAEYSPDGKYLAVGSHDTDIWVYDATNGYERVGKCTAHKATITCLDWCMHSKYIRSVCNGYELLFHTVPECDQDPSGASNTKATVWASGHAKFGWLVDGIFPKETSGDHINGVDMNADQTLIATGDDFGLVRVFRSPARHRVKPRSFRAHSEHVVRVKFGRDNLSNYLFSVGGYDQTLMQWKQKQ